MAFARPFFGANPQVHMHDSCEGRRCAAPRGLSLVLQAQRQQPVERHLWMCSHPLLPVPLSRLASTPPEQQVVPKTLLLTNWSTQQRMEG